MKVDLKSLLAGVAIGGVGLSIAMADQISVPNTFVAGTTARASEVNANFDALVQESNAQDQQIAAQAQSLATLQSMSKVPEEQLICRFKSSNSNWPVIGPTNPDNLPLSCISTSNNRIVLFTFNEIWEQGWRVSFIYGSSNIFYVFDR